MSVSAQVSRDISWRDSLSLFPIVPVKSTMHLSFKDIKFFHNFLWLYIYWSLKFAKVTIQLENSTVFYTHSTHYSRRQTIQSFSWSHYYIFRRRLSARNKVNPSGITTIVSARKGRWWRGGRARSQAQGGFFYSIFFWEDIKIYIFV